MTGAYRPERQLTTATIDLGDIRSIENIEKYQYVVRKIFSRLLITFWLGFGEYVYAIN